MKVEVLYRSDPERPLVDPLPETDGFVFRLVKGDVADPWMDPDGWFGPHPPAHVSRFWSRVPLPFLAWRWGGWSGYVGWKVFGADSSSYASWLLPDEIYPGSQAMCLSFRPFARSE